MTNKTVLSILNSKYINLTKSEKKVADLIFEIPEDIVYMTVSDISKRAEVGDSTVLRLCKKIGFSTFQDFKLTLLQEISGQEDLIKFDDYKIEEKDSLDTIAEKVVGYDNSIMKETLSLIDKRKLDEARKAIIKANKIYLYGVGASAITCQDVALKFMRVGLNAISHTEFHTQMMTAALLQKNDVAIGVSFSGSSNDTNKILSIAKKTGATIISVTHHADSQITKLSDLTLLHGGRETPLSGGDFSSKIAQMGLFDILYNIIYRDIKDSILSSSKKTSKAISETML